MAGSRRAPPRSVGMVMSKIGVALWKAGQVERGYEKTAGKGHDVFRVGEHDGRVTARATEVGRHGDVEDRRGAVEGWSGRARLREDRRQGSRRLPSGRARWPGHGARHRGRSAW